MVNRMANRADSTLTQFDVPEWVFGDGPEADIVISTRARLARSIASFPFPYKASNADLAAVANLVRAAAESLRVIYPGMASLRIDSLSDRDRENLVGAFITSPSHGMGGEGRVVILDRTAKLAIMVNEEDHLRLQTLLSGLATDDAWKLANQADSMLAAGLEYGFSIKYGYLTSSFSNVGTGLRLSAMMHLVGLAWLGRLKPLLKAAADLGVSVRGLRGEGTKPWGDMFQVSNEATLGMTEMELVDKVRSIGAHLLEAERDARRELLCGRRNNVFDRANRDLQFLKNSQVLAGEQALRAMSIVRLAFESGLIQECSRPILNRMLAGITMSSGEDFSVGVRRAKLARELLSQARMA
jgi:protein arginine kinase